MSEDEPGSILLKIRPWLESGGPFQPSDDEAAASVEEESFSALDLRDRVVVQLLQEEVVRVEQVKAAWNQRADEDPPDALWRVVAHLQDVETEAVFAEAARVYAFEPATSILYRSRALLSEHRGRFSLGQRRRLVALGVLPVKVNETPDGPRWLFATHDPARPPVHALLADLEVPAYELRYAPAAAIRERLEESFPGEVALAAHTADEGAADEGAADEKEASSKAPGGEDAPQTSEEGSPFALLDGLFEEAQEEAPAQPRRRGSETARTFASIYEELLSGAARSRAARVRLEADSGDQLAATFDYEERGEQRAITLQVPPEAVLSFMRRRTRATRRSAKGKPEAKTVHRWVEGRRHSFRIGALPERRDWTAGRADIRIEVVD